VSVTSVRFEHSVLSGPCTAGAPFIFTPLAFSVAPGASTQLVHGALYTATGAGCCRGTCPGVFCVWQENTVVVTGLGEVRAGAFAYGETFRGCSACTSSASQGCPSEQP
jgi:hypothetical protein